MKKRIKKALIIALCIVSIGIAVATRIGPYVLLKESPSTWMAVLLLALAAVLSILIILVRANDDE